MDNIFTNYIIQALLGGASGYITNDYAINMLFKEYTPLKIGGVIKKTRNEFIEKLSSMVENDIISKDKLQEILIDDEFKIKFENLAADFYGISLIDAVRDNTWDKIIGDDAYEFAKNTANEHSFRILNLLLNDLNINNFLTDKQLFSISSFLYNSIIELLESDEKTIENVLLHIYEHNKNVTADSIIHNDIYNNIVSNATESIIRNIANQPEYAYKNFFELAGAQKTLNQCFEIFKEKKIKNVVNLQNTLVSDFEVRFLSYINSDKGYGLINNLCNSLFNYGKKENKSVFELLDDTFEEKLKLYLIEYIPDLTDKIVNWIQKNNNIINTLIQDSMDDVIKESDGLKAKLLTTIKNTYLNNLGKKYSIVEKIVSYVKSITEPEKLSLVLSSKIIYILNNLTIKEMINEAENSGITSEKCAAFIVNYIKNNISEFINNALPYINEINIGDILPALYVNDAATDNIAAKFKEAASSQAVTDFFIKKLPAKPFDISALLCDIVNEKHAEEFSIKINNFIWEDLKKHEQSVKNAILNQMRAIAESAHLKLSGENISLINNALDAKLKDYFMNLKNTNLSLAVKRLDSINTAKNSSEYIRTYITENADTVLKGSVKLIVADNLNKLNDDELVGLANDFIGRELKPIMYFGGVLGVAAGIILAAFQNKTLNFAEINIANMAMYSFVGFITNVIAINMIFKPYNKNKLLDKIPFLKNFALAYIVKNQKVFAEKTAYFIDDSLLNKNGIQNLFDKNKDNIKNSFINTAKADDYNLIKKIFLRNKDNIACGLTAYLKNKLSSGIENLSSFISDNIKKISLSQIYNKFESKLKHMLKGVIKSEDIGYKIYASLNSEHEINLTFVKNKLKSSIDLLSEENLKCYMAENEDKFSLFAKKHIDEVFNDNQMNSFENFIGETIYSYISTQDNRDKIFQSVYEFFNRVINKNKTFEEVLGGRLKEYTDRRIPDITNALADALTENIQMNRSKISIAVSSEIKNSLGFLEKSMYSLMGGDEIVHILIKDIVEKKVPVFLDVKKAEINKLLSSFIDEKFYKSKAQVLYEVPDKLKLKDLANNYASENSAAIKNKIKTSSSIFINYVKNTNVGEIANLFYINSLNDIFNVYDKEIHELISNTSLYMNENSKNITDILNSICKISLKDIFKNITETDIENITENIVNILERGNDTDKIIQMFIGDFMKLNNNITVEQIINPQELNNSFKNYFKGLIENKSFENEIKNIFIAVIDDSISENFDFISDSSKEFLFGTFIDASIDSLKRNLNEILQSVEFDKMAKEEIEKMEPKKIHEMFDSFSGKYFKRLMLYGFGGFVFGINAYVGLALTLIKIISEFNKDK